MYSKVEVSNIVFRGVEVKKSEIRLKSENLHPCTRVHSLVATTSYHSPAPVCPLLTVVGLTCPEGR